MVTVHGKQQLNAPHSDTLESRLWQTRRRQRLFLHLFFLFFFLTLEVIWIRHRSDRPLAFFHSFSISATLFLADRVSPPEPPNALCTLHTPGAFGHFLYDSFTLIYGTAEAGSAVNYHRHTHTHLETHTPRSKWTTPIDLGTWRTVLEVRKIYTVLQLQSFGVCDFRAKTGVCGNHSLVRCRSWCQGAPLQLILVSYIKCIACMYVFFFFFTYFMWSFIN